MGHRDNATVCEVIPDRLLTNILWLKNPTIIEDIPLKSIIAVHSRKLFVDTSIWKRFYDNLRTLREEGGIGDRDISMLFYNHQIEEVLSDFNASQIETITPDFILREAGRISDEVDKRIEVTSKTAARRYVGIASWILAAGMVALLLALIPKVVEKWDLLEPVSWVINIVVSITVGLLGRQITLRKIRNRLEAKLSTKIHRRKSREVEELFRGVMSVE